jgi:hypothetical protein
MARTRHGRGLTTARAAIDDPKAYTKPLTYSQRQELLPDTELIEYICNENFQKPLRNVVGK